MTGRNGSGSRSAHGRWALGLLAAAGALLGCFSGAAAARPGVYYVAPGGNDRASGTSPSAAWRTLARVERASLGPGARVLLRRGGRWSGGITIRASGASGRPILFAAYGRGPAPRITGGRCLEVDGSFVTVSLLAVDRCARAGVKVSGDGVRVERNVITHNIAGVEVQEESNGARVTGNLIASNNRMERNTPGGSNDNGAFGVLLHGSGTVVAGNTITGSDAFSYDYGRDGSAVEIYGARGSVIRGNVAINNLAFTELGKPSSSGNTYESNVVRSSLPRSVFLITRGSGSGYGPIRGTRVVNNTVRLTGAASEGFVCHAGCGPDILFMRNNIIQAVKKAGYADRPFDEDYDLFSGGVRQFQVGPHSLVADPRFVAPGRGDLRLSRGSRAVDRGVATGLNVDILGRRIPLDGNGDGRAAPDIGAYELPR